MKVVVLTGSFVANAQGDHVQKAHWTDHRRLNLHHEIHHKSEPKTHTPTSTSNSDNMLSQHEDQPSDVFDADDGGSQCLL